MKIHIYPRVWKNFTLKGGIQRRRENSTQIYTSTWGVKRYKEVFNLKLADGATERVYKGREQRVKHIYFRITNWQVARKWNNFAPFVRPYNLIKVFCHNIILFRDGVLYMRRMRKQILFSTSLSLVFPRICG